MTFGLFLIDIDLDTDLDLFMANGHVYPDRLADQDKITFRQRPQLYSNNGQGLFDEYLAESGVLTNTLVARGAAYGDYDKDGDPDLLITENDGPVHLWRNDSQAGRWLRVQIEGTDSNRDGYGTLITAAVGALRMERRIRSGSSYLSQSESVATFGLGQAAQVDTLWIQWPSGAVVQFENIEADQVLFVREGANRFEAVAPPITD